MKRFKKIFTMKRRTVLLGGIFLFLLAATVTAALEKAGYDPYINKMAYAPSNRSLAKKIGTEFLTYPLELVRWPIKQVLFFVEDHHLVAKTRYIYKKLGEHGIIPKLAFTHWGVDIDLAKAFHVKDKLPDDFVSRTWAHYGSEGIFETGVRLGYEPFDGFHAFGNIKYDYRPDEDFYGIGPNTSRGDEASYKMEYGTFEGVAGYTHPSAVGIDFKAAYRNINISDSRDKDDAKVNQGLPGRSGDDLVTVGTELFWKPAQSDNPILSPSKVRLIADFNDGVHHSDARYFKFSGEVTKTFELGSPRRVFAMHFYGEHNNALPGRTVPFHQLARLGSFGTYPNLSHTLRGYEENRFYGESAALFNVEYRYRIYEYREWTVSHAIFFDDGQVFSRLDDFKFKNFRESYGTGLRLALQKLVLLDLSFAHGEEGSSFYIRNSQPF